MRGGLIIYRYVGGNPLYWIDPLGLAVEFCPAPADIAYGYVDHVWFKTNTKEAGVGGNAPNVGEEYESLYITDISVTDHTGQSKTRKGATCKIVPNVDEQKVNELLEIEKPLGQFSAFNNCQTFTNEVIEQSTKPTPPGRLEYSNQMTKACFMKNNIYLFSCVLSFLVAGYFGSLSLQHVFLGGSPGYDLEYAQSALRFTGSVFILFLGSGIILFIKILRNNK